MCPVPGFHSRLPIRRIFSGPTPWRAEQPRGRPEIQGQGTAIPAFPIARALRTRYALTMKTAHFPRFTLALLFSALLAPNARSIPQDFGTGGGFFAGAGLGDMTDGFLRPRNWIGKAMPGKWIAAPGLEGEEVRWLVGHPYVFGKTAQAVQTVSRGGRVESITINYLDAGAYFGFKPQGSAAEGGVPLKEKQRQFKQIYKDLDKDLRVSLAKTCDDRGEVRQVGRSAFLRGAFLDFPFEDFVIRYAANENHSINVRIIRKDALRDDYLDPALEEMPDKKREAAILAKVTRSPDGDVAIDGVPVFAQGPRPYCAISALGMVTHHLGLRLSVEDLAAGARLKNTGSAAGSKMIELYSAAAQEAGLKVMRAGSFDFERARRAIDEGFPVIVWRRYDAERDRLHTRFALADRTGRAAPVLPEPDDADRATWPGEDAPAHASIVTGYNAERNEVIFMESWGEHTRGRRMRAEELEGTGYMAFYFKL